MTSVGNTLAKSERLSGKKSISALLADGAWGVCGHFRYCWCSHAHIEGDGPRTEDPARILVSVPKRYFKRAVKRNLLKRRIREAYRIQKPCGIDIFFQYNSPEIADYGVILSDVTAILGRINSARK